MGLWILLLLPLATAAAIGIAGERQARSVALGGSLVTVGWAIVLAMQFPHWNADQWLYWPGVDQIEDQFPVLPLAGIRIILGVDSVSLLLVLLNLLMLLMMVRGRRLPAADVRIVLPLLSLLLSLGLVRPIRPVGRMAMILLRLRLTLHFAAISAISTLLGLLFALSTTRARSTLLSNTICATATSSAGLGRQ